MNPLLQKMINKARSNATIWKMALPLRRAVRFAQRGKEKDRTSALKNEYRKKRLNKVEDTFVLYRILGNDLSPLHMQGQTRNNLQFMLDHEPVLKNCEKRWVLNRIIDKDEEQAIKNLLDEYQQPYMIIPFEEEEYKSIMWDTDCLPEESFLQNAEYKKLDYERRLRLIVSIYKNKNNYVMNCNGARNAALQDGKSRAKWALPWDGNCFMTKASWEQIYSDVVSSPFFKYFTVPMARVLENSQLLSDDYLPNPVEEPQVIFRQDAKEQFNVSFYYGRRDKVELFWRLGIPGKWEQFEDEPWDVQRRPASDEWGQVGETGWVARLSSGNSSLASDNMQAYKNRGIVRNEAIINTLRDVDIMMSRGNDGPDTLTNISSRVLENERRLYIGKDNQTINDLICRLIADADNALGRGPYSVVDKLSLPPSGNKNDYWHPAPYWWPDPEKPDGRPYICRDGQRVPGTIMYEPESEKYDRTRLQMVFDDSLILALAWKFTGNGEYSQHGAKILERFFTNNDTAMTPNLKYAQVVMGLNNDMGQSFGIIEFKDMYFYLDAVRLLICSGAVSEETASRFKMWLSEYLQWLLTSEQGEIECNANNNHGTYYDLQVAAIASFLGNHMVLTETLMRAQSRISQQFLFDGSQPEELRRTITAHYCSFNLQGWINLAELASRWGIDLWGYDPPEKGNLARGVKWLLPFAGVKWPYEQIEDFDEERFLPIWFRAPKSVTESMNYDQAPKSVYLSKPKFHPHDGIRPYWNLGLLEG